MRTELDRIAEMNFAVRKAKEEGKAEGKAESIIELLGELGEVSQELQDEILAEKDLEELRRMIKLAAKAESIEDFVAKWKAPVNQT